MIDQGKRKSLKAMAGMAIGAATGAGALHLAVRHGGPVANAHATSAIGDATSSRDGLDIYFSPASDGAEQMVSIGNATASDAAVNHVYPGVVQVGPYRYDLNAALAESPLQLAPGHRKTFRLMPMRSEDEGVAMPRGLTHSRPVRVTSAYHGIDGRRFVSTTRSAFA